jgi:hypothetical protein
VVEICHERADAVHDPIGGKAQPAELVVGLATRQARLAGAPLLLAGHLVLVLLATQLLV